MITRRVVSIVTAVLSLAMFASKVSAQGLHTNDRWEECSIVLDPSLTPGAWRQFVSELGIVTYFRPMTSARSMGRGNFEFALVDWGTEIDDADAAWNDTFSHPDSTHWLFEGDALKIPGLMVRAGVTDKVDVGAYFTKSVGANYGFIGGQVQYSLLKESPRGISAAGRLSVVRLIGPEELQASTYGVDLVVSRQVLVFEPYVAVSGYMARARETTHKVNLEDESAFGGQATLGVTANVGFLRLGGEVHFAKVNGMSMKVAFGL